MRDLLGGLYTTPDEAKDETDMLESVPLQIDFVGVVPAQAREAFERLMGFNGDPS